MTTDRKIERDRRLFGAINTALRPAGMLSDLSRIIAEFARPIRWTDSQGFTTDAEGRRLSSIDRYFPAPLHYVWAVSDTPIGQFPYPSPSTISDAKDRSSLRVWTIRVDKACMEGVFLGICKPSTVPDYDQLTNAHSITVWTHSSAVFVGTDKEELNFLHTPQGEKVDGSLYHFTADLSTGSLRVRPIIKRVYAPRQSGDLNQTEWTIAEGIADLADCRAAVSVASNSAFAVLTILCG